VVAAVLLIPVWPLSITAGVVFGTLGFILVPVSATLGAAAAFLISRHFARGKIRDWLARRPHYRAIDQAIAEEGWKVVALLRLSPLVPYNLMNYFCGMTGVTFPMYLLATFLGSVPVTAMYVYLGLVGQAVARGPWAGLNGRCYWRDWPPPLLPRLSSPERSGGSLGSPIVAPPKRTLKWEPANRSR
jgi:uncharacterized membrane protein YdjX (TVP38/TMEM64 family)